MAQLEAMGLSWGEALAAAKDRTLWRNIVVALCPTGDEKDKYTENTIDNKHARLLSLIS